MSLYLISYDLRKAGRNYTALYNVFAQWKAVRLLDSEWLAALTGPAIAIRNILTPHMDSNDGLAVLNLQRGADWSTFGCPQAANTVLGILNQ